MKAAAAFMSFFIAAFITGAMHLPALVCIGAGLLAVLAAAAWLPGPRHRGRW